MSDQKPWEQFSQPLNTDEQKPWESFGGKTEQDKGRGALGFVRDAAVSAAKGVVGVPESIVGMADLVTGGHAGKSIEDAGVRFKDAKDAIGELNTDQQKAADKEVSDAKGFFPTIGAALRNPSTIVNSAIESAPSMLAGGAASRGALALAPKMSPILAGAIGEGAVAAGQNAEQVRQQSADGLLTPEQSAILAASGAVTGGLGFGAGRLANKLGIGDIQTMLASGKLGAVGDNAIATGASKNFVRKAAEGAAVEGALQELPQSYQEQVAQNIAQGKPWDEGALEAGAQGMLAGGLMGAVGGSFHGETAHTDTSAATPAADDQIAPQQEPVIEPQPDAPIANPQYEGGLNYETPNVRDIALQNAGNNLSIDETHGSSGVNFERQPVPKLSEQMGIDSNAGPMSSAAAIAVDSGAHQQVVDQQAQQQSVELAQKQGNSGKSAPTGDLTGAAQLAPSVETLQAHNAAFYAARNKNDINGMIDAANNAAQSGADDKQLGTYSGLINRTRKDTANPADASAALADARLNQQEQPQPQVTAHPVSEDALQNGQKWNDLTKTERKAVLANTDIHPIVANTAWDNIAPKVKDKLLDAMLGQDATAKPATSDTSLQDAQPSIAQADSTQNTAINGLTKQWNDLVQQYKAADESGKASLKPSLEAVDNAIKAEGRKELAGAKSKIADASKAENEKQVQSMLAEPVSTRMRPSEFDESKGIYWEKTAADEWTGQGDWFQKGKTRSSAEMAKYGGLVPLTNSDNAKANAPETQAPANIKEIVAKQIPDMTDAELQQAADYYGPDHARTAKLNKAIANRGETKVSKSTPLENTDIGNTDTTVMDGDQWRSDMEQALKNADQNHPNYRKLASFIKTKAPSSASDRATVLRQAKEIELKPTSLKEGIAKAQANAKAKAKPQPAKQEKTLIGKNAEGQNVFEDHNGIRYRDLGNGFLAGESVGIRPGHSNPYDTSSRTDEHRTVAEIEAAKPATEPKAADYGSKNTLVSVDRAEELRKKLQAKLRNQLPSGIDPEILAMGAELAVFHIEAGVRKFADFAKTMASDLDMPISKIKPYLRSWYNGARDMMEDANVSIDGMDNPDIVRTELAKLSDESTLANTQKDVQNINNVTPKGKNNGQSTELGASGQGTLERVSANDVQKTPSERNTGREATGSSAKDSSGHDGLGGQRLSSGRGVADGSGTVSSTARGKGNTSNVQRGNSGQLDFNDGVDPNQVITSQNAPDGAFNITTDDDIGGGGAKTKFKNNIAAIELLKQLESENRPATKDEQKILAKFVGWGGLSGAFVRDDGSYNKGWEKEAKGLESLLTEDEYKAAVDSSITAHYTSPEIVRAMWQAVQQMGFTGGRVLEPSVGVGNFFGAMPAGLRAASSLHGVELDHITGGIAKNLYPQAKIKAPMGFQDYTFNDGHFDLVIGNPPFSSMTIHDGDRRAINGFNLHNYFFAKSIDSLREGGVLAMVVTNRMMDSNDDKARLYIDKHAKLLGAIRLPNNAFLKNAGTEVTTDIVFLQKRTAGEEGGGRWKTTKQYMDKQGKSVPLNNYFIDNPQMMLGEFGAYGSMYTPDDPALIAREGQDTAKLLSEAIATLAKDIMPKVGFQDIKSTEAAIKHDISHVKVGSVFMSGDSVYAREPDLMGEQQSSPVEGLSATAIERIKGMIGVRDVLGQLRLAQLTKDATESSLAKLRADLNTAYDAFVKKHGFINQSANKAIFHDDPSYPQIAALEDSFDKGISPAVAKSTGEVARSPSAKKAAIFSKRTQNPLAVVESVTSAKDAMVESLNRHGNIDLDHMATLYGKSSDEIVKELGDLVYQDPIDGWVTHDQYLSGNVKQKLAQAKEQAKSDRAYARNVEALEKVQPEDIEAIDIAVKPGAHWVPRADVEAFVKHIAGSDNPASASYNKVSAKWSIGTFPATAAANTQWGTDRVDAKNIVEHALAQSQATVYDRFPDGSATVNQDATQAANNKVAQVAAEWKKWIWDDEERRDRLAHLYNDSFNTDVQRAYDGSHLALPGKVDDSIIRLRPTQINAIWRMVQSESTLADHVVGAGKTFTLIGAAMEMRRMGLAQKPMFVVPNHLVGQWASDFLKLYPNANILAATKKDFDAKNRKKFVARIATGDYDAVIVAHSSFGKIKIDPNEEAQFIKAEIQELLDAEADDRAANGKNSRNAKDYAKRRLTLEEKFKKLVANENKDADNLHWHELGVDALFLDEAHEFKNLSYVTGMQRIAGLGNQKGSQKATDLFMKINSMKNNIAKSKVTFATGTPISNTMAEMYTMQRYLDLSRMKEQGIATFDAWARMFGEIVSDWELSPAGKYKMNSRFSKFANMPELMQRYLSFADVINRDDIARMGTPLNVPLIIGGKPMNIVVERSDTQAEYLGVPTMDDNGNEVYPEGSLIYRSEHLPKKAEKGADNMLKIMSDARKAALDMRLIDPSAADEPNSKVNEAVKRTIELYHKWNDDKGTQLIFCDLSTPKGAVAAEKARIEELVRKADEGDEAAIEQLDNLTPDELDALNGSFSVYDDMKQKFINQGIPEKEIAFIHDAKTDLQKEELFGKVRSGQVRILMGSTAKMGAGMNAQERLVGLHHIDAPWRPSDLEQREGRIIRQGNALRERDPAGFEVAINRYATKQTLDSRMWETLERKAKFIEQVRKGDGKQRVIEDIGGESANSAEMKAASSGNPLILEEMTLRKQVKTLEDDRSQHLREQYRVQKSLNQAAKDVPRLESLIEVREKEVTVPTPEELAITVNGQEFKQGMEGARDNAGKQLLNQAEQVLATSRSRVVGQYGGFKISMHLNPHMEGIVELRLTSPYDEEYHLGVSPASQSALGLVTRVINLVGERVADLEKAKKQLKDNISSIPKLQAQLGEWDKQNELDEAIARHSEVIDQLRPKQKVEEAKADTDPAVKFSFAGQKAIGADLHSLANAKQRIGAGDDAESVRQDTGWHRGVDGKWRFEISDDQAEVKPFGDTAGEAIESAKTEAVLDGRKRATVGDMLDHPQLFAAYPALSDIPVSNMPAGENAQARIQAFATGLEIQLADNMPRSDIASAVLHELQHAIQNNEGFAMGGSRKAFISDYDKTGAQTYKRLAGEVEARNTQMRKTMTPALRTQIAPSETADTADNKILVSFNGKDITSRAMPNNAFRPAMSVESLKSAFSLKYPELVPALSKMIARGKAGQRGGVVMLDSADPLRIAHDFAQKTGTPFGDAVQMFSEDGSINGFYDPKSGLTFLVGPNLDAWTGPAVLLHEMVHGQQRASIDKQALAMLMNRGQVKNKELSEFLDRVATRMIDVGETANAQEATAYIVEQAVMEGQAQGFGNADSRFLSWVDSKLGQRVGDLIRSFLKMTRQWMLRNGMPISNITVSDMVDYAKSGLNRAAEGDVKNIDKPIAFSRSGVRDIASKATAELNKRFSAPGKLSAWHKTVGTMYNLAERSPAFKPVFTAAQNFIDDVSFYASEAAELAPKILPKLDAIKDITKKPISADDNKAIAKPIFEGTLLWGRDRDGTPVLVDSLSEAASKLSTERKAEILEATGNLQAGIHKAWKALPAETYAKMINSRYETVFLKPGVVWTDDELKSLFSLNDGQIALYHEFRDSLNQSLESMTKAEMMRIGGKDVKDMQDQVMSAKTVNEAANLLMERLSDIAMTEPDRATSLFQASHDIQSRADSTIDLQQAGYAPLSRFGKYTVDVVEDGERQYFGLFETMHEANTMAAQLRAEFGDSNVSQGTLSAESYKLFAGITPESLELFGNMLGLESDGDKARDQAFQEYIRLTKNNRSAMKRLIHRKGVAGYSEDVGRVLASFIYSNARQTAGGLHMGDLDEAVQAIPKGQGELTDVAVKLRDYIKNPQEEAQAIRGLLFAQYLGGSIASAIVNMTQPLAVTFPFLSQYGGARKAASQLTKAAKQLAGKGAQFEPELVAAMKRAEEDGTLSPQEVHQLMAQARGNGSLKAGDGTRIGEAQALAQNSMTRFSLAWGKLFGAAEQINRRVTFIAAYRMAKEQGMANADTFARHAVTETQFVYSKASKMQWGRGAIGGTLMTFKTYSIAYLELMHRLWSQGEAGSDERKQGRKASMLMIATLMLLSGAGGLPFADDLNDLIDALAQIAGYNFSSKKAKQQFLEETFGKPAADFIDKGITGLPGMPLDVSGRLGMGNLLPGTGLLKESNDHTRDVMELFGPAGDFATRVGTGARQVVGGDVTGGLLQAAPTAFRNLAKGVDMANTGMYRDQKGYKVLETSNLEAALKAIGFQPSSVADIQEANGLNQGAKAFYSLKAQEIRAQWANGIFLKDPNEVQAARDAIATWNEKNPDQRMIISIASVLKKAKEMAKSKDQRIADTAPKAMRAQMREDIAHRRAEALN